MTISMISLGLLLIIALCALILFNSLVNWLAHGSGARLKPLRQDPTNIRSHITLKPLPRFYDRALHHVKPYESQMAMELFERLRQRGAMIKRVSMVGHAQRVLLQFDDVRWELTMGPFQTHPEQWLIKVDRVVGRKTRSAPHDCAQSRAMLTLIKSVLEGMEVSTVRWHYRQNWNAGRIDVWSHKPFVS
jgi:hypothetical protein